jgi:hypothetical protein
MTATVETLTAETRVLPLGLHAHLIMTASPLVVWIPAARAAAPVLHRLAEVLRAHPGAVRVQVRAYRGDRYQMLSSGLRVDTGPGLTSDLKQLLGPACLTPHPCRASSIGRMP